MACVEEFDVRLEVLDVSVFSFAECALCDTVLLSPSLYDVSLLVISFCMRNGRDKPLIYFLGYPLQKRDFCWTSIFETFLSWMNMNCYDRLVEKPRSPDLLSMTGNPFDLLLVE